MAEWREILASKILICHGFYAAPPSRSSGWWDNDRPKVTQEVLWLSRNENMDPPDLTPKLLYHPMYSGCLNTVVCFCQCLRRRYWDLQKLESVSDLEALPLNFGRRYLWVQCWAEASCPCSGVFLFHSEGWTGPYKNRSEDVVLVQWYPSPLLYVELLAFAIFAPFAYNFLPSISLQTNQKGVWWELWRLPNILWRKLWWTRAWVGRPAEYVLLTRASGSTN